MENGWTDGIRSKVWSVWAAWPTSTAAPIPGPANAIAVKVLKEEFLDNEELVRRFKNESKAISILNHPNIVKVYDVIP